MFPTFLSFTERHPRYVALIGFSFFVMGIVLYGFQYIAERTTDTLPTENSAEIQESFPVPTRTDFGTTTPGDFITDIPLEDGIEFSQSYSLEYPEQQQFTVVFDSTKSITENYSLYFNFMNEKGWGIMNGYESENVSSLYAQKDGVDINVTIAGNSTSSSTQSHVSISILKK